MKQWVQRQIDNGFNDFKGLSIAARIPLRDAFVNELIAEALHTAATPAAAPAAAGSVDVRSFLKFVEKAEVHASDGIIALDLVVKV